MTTTPKTDLSLLSVKDLAESLNCSKRHIRRLTDAGRMPPPIRVGRLLRWRRDDIARWVADGCKPLDGKGGVK